MLICHFLRKRLSLLKNWMEEIVPSTVARYAMRVNLGVRKGLRVLEHSLYAVPY